MAFSLQHWSRNSVGYATDFTVDRTTQTATSLGANNFWSYKNINDTLETILASGYFNPVAELLQTDDLIYVAAQDFLGLLYVANVLYPDNGGNNALVTTSRTNFSAVQTSTAFITSAELLTLRANPVTVVAAPPAGRAIVFLNAMLNYQFGTTPYVTGGNDSAFRLLKAPATFTTVSSTITSAGWLDQGASTDTTAIELANNQISVANASNAALVWANTGAGEWTGGDGNVNIFVSYLSVSVS